MGLCSSKKKHTCLSLYISSAVFKSQSHVSIAHLCSTSVLNIYSNHRLDHKLIVQSPMEKKSSQIGPYQLILNSNIHKYDQAILRDAFYGRSAVIFWIYGPNVLKIDCLVNAGKSEVNFPR